MKEQKKYTKKASARIMKEVIKVEPKVSLNTSFDQAFCILMEHWNLTLGVEIHNKTKHDDTICTLYKDDEIATTWTMPDIFDESVHDWDWNVIYKTVLEDIIKRRLYKRAKPTRKRTCKTQNKMV